MKIELTPDMKGPLPSGSKGNSAAKRIAVLKRVIYVRQQRQRGWSDGQIARSLGISQQSVSELMRRHDAKMEAAA